DRFLQAALSGNRSRRGDLRGALPALRLAGCDRARGNASAGPLDSERRKLALARLPAHKLLLDGRLARTARPACPCDGGRSRVDADGGLLLRDGGRFLRRRLCPARLGGAAGGRGAWLAAAG